MKLEKLNGYSPFPGPVVVVIMDGMGLGPRDDSDGVYMGHTPQLDELCREKLFVRLKAHGTAVGMPTDGDMGNSEVGHNALGAGRVFAQGARLVGEALASGRIFQGRAWQEIKARCARGGTLHLLGMVSDGNVHSHIDHLYGLLEQAAAEGFARVRVHGLLDGRDVGEKSALDYFVPLEEKLAELSRDGRDYRLASGGGRMVTTMDRYNADWSVVENGWQAHVLGQGRQFDSAVAAIKTYYAEDPAMTDQYMASFVVVENGEPVGTIEDGDAVVLFNFRGDRAIEISRAFTEPDFAEFDRQRFPDVFYAGMMEYDDDAHIPPHYLVEPPAIDHTLGEYLCAAGVTSFAISETQKFGHVTYFWNGNRSGYIDPKLETYVEIPSDKIQFDKAPKMKAPEITEKTLELLREGDYRFGRLNFANGDMVGHTGVMEAAIVAVETVDECVGKLIEAVRELEGITVITADHGNSDDMFSIKNGKKQVKTAHSLNPVPFWIVDSGYAGEYEMADVENPGLSNVAATLLNLLGYEKPEDYDRSLIRFS